MKIDPFYPMLAMQEILEEINNSSLHAHFTQHEWIKYVSAVYGNYDELITEIKLSKFHMTRDSDEDAKKKIVDLIAFMSGAEKIEFAIHNNVELHTNYVYVSVKVYKEGAM